LVAIDAGTLISGIIDILVDQEDHGQHKTSAHHIVFPRDILPYSLPTANAFHIVSTYLGSICITHEHLDHISGVVLNSAGFSDKHPKILAALPDCINKLTTHIFNGSIWPNLTNEGIQPANYLLLNRLEPNQSNSDLCKDLVITPCPISHGSHAEQQRRMSSPGLHKWSTYDSTAYFLEDNVTGKVLLVWGDVEPDAISFTPRNASVWEKAAHYIRQDRALVGIMIECSFTTPQADRLLFGHMTPKYLVSELCYLASMNAQEDLSDITVIITHVKEDLTCIDPEQAPRKLIFQDVKHLASKAGLKCKFIVGTPGLSLSL
jgi:cAMP phosphodiesterase